ncbi:hypothetical protein N7490_000984 [Penicillium lividum]|nr:hypothetical protein N7490_000984 [Penicillium lividum]
MEESHCLQSQIRVWLSKSRVAGELDHITKLLPKEELRSHFQGWVAETFPSENPCAEKKLIHDDEPVPRYRFFFELDEDALRSCGSTSLGHANFVDGFWGSSGQPRARNMNSASEENSNQLQDQREAVEGSSDVGWMKTNLAFLMDPHFYAGMSGSTEGECSVSLKKLINLIKYAKAED